MKKVKVYGTNQHGDPVTEELDPVGSPECVWRADGKVVESEISFFTVPEPSEWTCHLFGGYRGHGMVYKPTKGAVPNWFVRWMMKICFDCKWVKNERKQGSSPTS